MRSLAERSDGLWTEFGPVGSSRLSSSANPRGKGRDLQPSLPRLSSRGRDRSQSAEQRVTDQYDDLPNSWTFGVYLFGELYSSVRISVLTLGVAGVAVRRRLFGEILHPRLDRGEVIIDPARFVADPDKVKRFPGTALSDAAAGLHGVRIFQRRPRAGDRACRASGVLSPCVPARDHRRTPHVPGPAQAGRADGGGFSDDAAKRYSSAIRSCVRPRSSGGCCSSAPTPAARGRPRRFPNTSGAAIGPNS